MSWEKKLLISVLLGLTLGLVAEFLVPFGTMTSSYLHVPSSTEVESFVGASVQELREAVTKFLKRRKGPTDTSGSQLA